MQPMQLPWTLHLQGPYAEQGRPHHSLTMQEVAPRALEVLRRWLWRFCAVLLVRFSTHQLTDGNLGRRTGRVAQGLWILCPAAPCFSLPISYALGRNASRASQGLQSADIEQLLLPAHQAQPQMTAPFQSRKHSRWRGCSGPILVSMMSS